MHHALEYVQGKLNILEQSAFFEHVLTCSACQDDLIIYLRLKQATAPIHPAPVFTIPKPDNYVVQSLNLARSALTLGLRLIPLGDMNE